MNLHLGIHDRFVELFLQWTGLVQSSSENIFLVYGEKEIPFSTYEYANLHVLPSLSGEVAAGQFVKEARNIYIHYLTDEVIDFLNKYDLRNKKIIWVFWGNDGFSLKIIRKNYSVPYPSLSVYFSAVKDLVAGKRNFKKEKFIYGHVDYFAHYIPADFELLKTLFKPTVEFVNFSYGSCERLIRDVEITGNDLLIGNSADPSNFHPYMIKKLLPRNFRNAIYCPLSYGGPKEYAIAAATLGEQYFGERFKAINQILSQEEYLQSVLSRISFALMWHNRSQAWGNIMQLLYQGTKVFMNPQSNLYKLLAKEGFAVFPAAQRLKLQDLKIISSGERRNNQKLLQNLYGNDSTCKRYRFLLLLNH